MESLQQLELSKNHENSVDENNKETISESKLSYEEQKEYNRIIRRLEREIEVLEKDVHKWELKTKEIETKLSTPEGAADPTLYQKHLEAEESIISSMKEWEKAVDELEQKKNEQK